MPQSSGLGSPASQRLTPTSAPNAGIQGQLKEEVAGEPTRGVVHGHDGAMEVVAPDQANQPIPQVVTRQKNEDREDQNDAPRPGRAEQRHGDIARDREVGLPDVEHRGCLRRRDRACRSPPFGVAKAARISRATGPSP